MTERNRGAKYRYRLVEYLTTAGGVLPPIIYDYRLERDHLEAEIIVDTQHDTRFLPIVFRPPVPKDGTNTRLWERYFNQGSILHAPRILQLLQYDQQQSESPAGKQPLSISDVCDVCERWFGLHRDVTKVLLFELEVFELCTINRELFTDSPSDFSTIQLAPKGKIFLDHMIYDVAYLNLSAMRLYISQDHDPADFVTLAQRPTSHEQTDWAKTINRWIRAKLRNSITMLGFISYANNLHRDLCNQYAPDQYKESCERELWEMGAQVTMLEQTEQWISKAKNEIEAILDSNLERKLISEQDIDELKDLIDRKSSAIQVTGET